MLTYIVRRLLALIPVVLGVILIVSSLIRFIPGDPVDVIAGPYATERDKAELKKSLGLDQPYFVQLTTYFKDVLRGDLGTSIIKNQSVVSLISERAGATIELALLSILLAVCISLPLGILSAVKAGSSIDLVSMWFALLGVAIPNFWLGPMLVLLFSLKLGWLPVSERTDLSSYVLPCLTLGTALAAILTRMTRTSFLENLGEDYVRTARAKGQDEPKILFKHVLKNASLPIVTIIGLQFGVLLTGAVITERVFDWPGLGTLMLDAINNRDYPVVQGCVLIFSTSYLVVNLLTDIAYGIFDPRIKLS